MSATNFLSHLLGRKSFSEIKRTEKRRQALMKIQILLSQVILTDSELPANTQLTQNSKFASIKIDDWSDDRVNKVFEKILSCYK